MATVTLLAIRRRYSSTVEQLLTSNKGTPRHSIQSISGAYNTPRRRSPQDKYYVGTNFSNDPLTDIIGGGNCIRGECKPLGG